MGRDCVPRLNGMWAFLIHDRSSGRIFGSRDRFGIKPLYWHRAGDRFLFASEIKALVASGVYRPAPRWEVAADYLVHGHDSAGDEGEATFYDQVFQVPPGTAFELDPGGRWTSWRYWSLEDFPAEDLEDPREEFAALFEDSVRLRLRSDVPVGVCLSGGLDSTSILCAMARQRERGAEALEAFSYHARDFDERPYVDETVRQTGATLNRIDLAGAVEWDRWARICWYYDQPVHSTAPMVGYELMALARSRGVKVVLNGQGADEILAGYHDYFRRYWHTLLLALRWRAAWREIRAYGSGHGLAPGRLLRESLRRLVRSRFRRLGPYRRLAAWRRRVAASRNPWFCGPLVEHLPKGDAAFRDFTLRQGLVESVERSPLPLFLRAEDRNSMAHGVEARLPFLDHRLVALCFRAPDRWKLRGPLNKFLLREAMQGRIPESVRSRVDKMGFPTQQRDWFAGPWYEPLQDMLASRETRERGIYRIDALREGLERHRRGETDLAPLFTSLVMLEFWLRGCLAAPADARA